MEDSLYPMRRLCDVGVTLLDCEHRTPASAPVGYPYVAIPNIRDGQLDLTGVRRISREDFDLWTRKTKPKAGDIIMTRRARVGDIAVVPDGLECAIGQNIVILRSNGQQIDQSYLRWVLRGPLFEEQKQRFLNVGAVFDSLNCGDIPQFSIPVPPLAVQRSIAAILGTLDDKIELNRRMNETLEAMARAIFTSWFVDFDPVRAKMEGRQPFGMDVDSAALFPDSLEDSTLGEIPAGWPVRSLDDCSSYLSRGVAPKYVEQSNVQVLNQRAIRWWTIDASALKFHDPDKQVRQEAYIRKGDVVINSTGDVTLGRAYWFFDEVMNIFADSHVSIIRTTPSILLPEMVAYRMETQYYQDLIYGGFVTGSTGQLELSRSNLARLPLLCPPIALQKVFSAKIAPWFGTISNNKRQNTTFSTVRDSLLSKLLSGEVRVG